MTEQILKELQFFTGTEQYHKFNLSNNVLTDGMKKFMELCKCSWLLTDIDAYFITNHKKINEIDGFYIATIKVSKDKKAVMTIKQDAGKKPIITQKYTYTDFPLKEFEFYIIKQSDYWVYLLQNEY